jgi:hypothetical protein
LKQNSLTYPKKTRQIEARKPEKFGGTTKNRLPRQSIYCNLPSFGVFQRFEILSRFGLFLSLLKMLRFRAVIDGIEKVRAFFSKFFV